jgi:hypothetical protein
MEAEKIVAKTQKISRHPTNPKKLVDAQKI